MLALALTQILLAITALGAGALAEWGLSLLGPKRSFSLEEKGLSLAERGLLGILSLSWVALSLNLFLPLTPPIRVFFFLACLLSFLFNVSRDRGNWRDFLILGVLITLLSGATLASYLHYDSGLYHLPSIRWSQASATPFGLTQIYPKLGFVSSWFPLAALMAIPGIELPSVFGLNTLAGAFILLFLLNEAFGPKGGEPVPRFYGVMTLALLAGSSYAFYGQMGSPSTDLPAAIFTFAAIQLWLRGEPRHCILAFLFSISAAMIKLSALPVVAIGFFFCRGLSPKTRVAIVLAAFLPWVLRSWIASGCLLYPQPQACFSSLPWAADLGVVRMEKQYIRSWAILPGAPLEILDSWSWLGGWARRQLESKIIVATLGLSGIGLTVGLITRRRRRVLPKLFLPLFMGVFGLLIFWFYQAPDVRFAFAPLLSFGTLVFLWGAAPWLSPKLSHTRVRLTGECALLCVVAAFSLKGLLARPDLRRWYPRLPQPGFALQMTDGGVPIRALQSGDQCWDTPLPCAPHPKPSLTQRILAGRPAFILK